MIWLRKDWEEPVGRFDKIITEVRSSCVEGVEFNWTSWKITALYLSRKSAMLLLQGMKISDLLIPNAEIKTESGDSIQPPHLALWSKWDPSDPVPALRDVFLAFLPEIPESLSPHQVFLALVEEAARQTS